MTKIAEVMSQEVLVVRPHHTVGHARKLMTHHGIHALPVIGPDEEPVGIITSSDLVAKLKDGTPVSKLMSDQVVVLSGYNDVSAAARTMRNQHIHHIVVTHEKKVVGVLSSFDLLALIENKRFVARNPPTPRKSRISGD